MRPAAVLLILLSSTPGLPANAQTAAERNVLRDLQFLASDRLAGRFTGSPQADSAADYIGKRLGQAGARPAGDGWRTPFEIAPDVPGLKGIPEAAKPRRGVNVVGIIRGSDPAL